MTQTLTATLPRDNVFYAGAWPKPVSAGTLIVVSQDAVESGRDMVWATLASNHRIGGYVYAASLIPA